jgi:aminomethyltransferase
MVEFANYQMPVQYEGEHGGVMKEHLFTRNSCGIFDVSHMGQMHMRGKDAAAFLEHLTVVDTQALDNGQGSLSLLMNKNGGIKDDCIITKVSDDHFYIVLNAGCKTKDISHMRNELLNNKKKFGDVDMQIWSETIRSLIAV